jgi:hypothetical protein
MAGLTPNIGASVPTKDFTLLPQDRDRCDGCSLIPQARNGLYRGGGRPVSNITHWRPWRLATRGQSFRIRRNQASAHS